MLECTLDMHPWTSITRYYSYLHVQVVVWGRQAAATHPSGHVRQSRETAPHKGESGSGTQLAASRPAGQPALEVSRPHAQDQVPLQASPVGG